MNHPNQKINQNEAKLRSPAKGLTFSQVTLCDRWVALNKFKGAKGNLPRKKHPPSITPLHPWKVTCNQKMKVRFRWCSFAKKRWFSSFLAVKNLQGVQPSQFSRLFRSAPFGRWVCYDWSRWLCMTSNSPQKNRPSFKFPGLDVKKIDVDFQVECFALKLSSWLYNNLKELCFSRDLLHQQFKRDYLFNGRFLDLQG